MFLFILVVLKLETQLTPWLNVRFFGIPYDFEKARLQSPQEIGSYLAGLVGDVHDGTTPSTQLKFRPILAIRNDEQYLALRLTKEERH